jgi:hypothetical protein
MRTSLARGIAVVSVCCESGQTPQPIGEIHAVGHLLSLCQRLEVRATWALSQPGHSPAAKLFVGRPEQEVALLARPLVDVSTTKFTKELLRGVLAGGAFGAPLSTVFVGDAVEPAMLEVMAKYGIEAICRSDASKRSPIRPRRLRFGIDEFVPDATFPAGRSWFGGGMRRVGGLLMFAAQRQSLVHLAFDVARIAASPRRLLARSEKILTMLARMVREGQLESETIRGAGDHLASRRTGQPAISILRQSA